jgi:hypothetical protein
MSDGYFFEPETAKIIAKAKSAADLRKLKPIASDDKWIKDQVALVKKLTKAFGSEVATFYNIFAPATAFKWAAGGDKKLAAFIKEDKEAVIYALSVIAHNTAILAHEVIKSGKADYQFVEIMACPGGCVMGGGQPIKSSKVRETVDVRKLRADCLYSIDENRLYTMGTLETADGEARQLGFRTEYSEWYPSGNYVICSFGKRLRLGQYKNYIKGVGNAGDFDGYADNVNNLKIGIYKNANGYGYKMGTAFTV